MKISKAFLRGEPLERWCEYEDGFAVLVECPEPAEWAAALNADDKDAAVKSLVLGKTKGWRGLDDEDGPVAFTRDALDVWVTREPMFGAWLTRQMADLASFRSPAGNRAAGPERVEVAVADVGGAGDAGKAAA